jgi:putative serine protease PepD
MSEFTHRYGDNEQTSVLPPLGGEPPQEPPASRSRSRKGAAGLLLGALLLGGVGGVAGAAGFDVLYDEPNEQASTTSTPLQTGGDNAPASSSSDDTPAPEGSVEEVAATVLPSVVKINVAAAGSGGSGSGIILTSDGEILTNNHVVEVAEAGGEIIVNFDDGSSAPATVVGTDPVTDLAVIRAEDVSGLTPATVGDSTGLDVGQEVVAVGSPFGLEATVTSGIVSSLNRPVTVSGGNSLQGERTTYPAIQTDAAINPGNSGGPLVDMAGEVVGVNSSIRSSSSALGGEAGSIGLGFAIPISKVLPIVEQLRNGETPTHAQLGVTVSDPVGENGMVLGAAIETVNPGSAGEEAGLEPGDIVTRVNDESIADIESLIATIRGYRPGDEVTLTVVRDGETMTLEATLDSDVEG